MIRTIKFTIIISLLMFPAFTNEKEYILKDFKSDGCSLFPDQNYFSGVSWCECCVVHDIDYWKGGNLELKKAADLKLRECVLNKSGDSALAETIYYGVDLGGGEIFPNWYRWGYGWKYGINKKIPDSIRQMKIAVKDTFNLENIIKNQCREPVKLLPLPDLKKKINTPK